MSWGYTSASKPLTLNAMRERLALLNTLGGRWVVAQVMLAQCDDEFTLSRQVGSGNG
jgi:hypothetical protein